LALSWPQFKPPSRPPRHGKTLKRKPAHHQNQGRKGKARGYRYRGSGAKGVTAQPDGAVERLGSKKFK